MGRRCKRLWHAWNVPRLSQVQSQAILDQDGTVLDHEESNLDSSHVEVQDAHRLNEECVQRLGAYWWSAKVLEIMFNHMWVLWDFEVQRTLWPRDCILGQDGAGEQIFLQGDENENGFEDCVVRGSVDDLKERFRRNLFSTGRDGVDGGSYLSRPVGHADAILLVFTWKTINLHFRGTNRFYHCWWLVSMGHTSVEMLVVATPFILFRRLDRSTIHKKAVSEAVLKLADMFRPAWLTINGTQRLSLEHCFKRWSQTIPAFQDLRCNVHYMRTHDILLRINISVIFESLVFIDRTWSQSFTETVLLQFLVGEGSHDILTQHQYKATSLLISWRHMESIHK